MKLVVLGSNSAGNGYILIAKNECLIIEAGIHLDILKKALDFDLSKIAGCLITHEHMDHCRYHMSYALAGIDLYGSDGTFAGNPGKRYHVVKANIAFQVGQFKVMPFNIIHDAREPFGYLINHEESGNIVFLTDTKYSKYRFPGVNNLIIEANYSKKIIDEKLFSNKLNDYLYNRIINSHMSLETCIDLLRANDLRQVNNIVLIHLSDSNSNEKEFVKAVKDVTGKTVIAANKNQTFELNKQPF